MNESGTKVDQLVRQCISLGGKGGDISQYGYGPSLCAHCRKPVKAEGQEALQAMSTAEGLYFRCKIVCDCGCSLGFVAIEKQDD
jgi:hypothetical protein